MNFQLISNGHHCETFQLPGELKGIRILAAEKRVCLLFKDTAIPPRSIPYDSDKHEVKVLCSDYVKYLGTGISNKGFSSGTPHCYSSYTKCCATCVSNPGGPESSCNRYGHRIDDHEICDDFGGA